MMTLDATLLGHLLDSLKDPFVFADTDHVVRYLNREAIARHGEELLGTSIFDCHNERSNETIRQVFERMKSGLDEELITDNDRHKIYMRAVRDEAGELLGYYERYEPPTTGA